MASSFTYIFEKENHNDTSADYMMAIGMDSEQVDAVLRQQTFELSQNTDKRQLAYKNESDPLYIEWQYDNDVKKEQIWRDKVEEIKLRYPLS